MSEDAEQEKAQRVEHIGEEVIRLFKREGASLDEGLAAILTIAIDVCRSEGWTRDEFVSFISEGWDRMRENDA